MRKRRIKCSLPLQIIGCEPRQSLLHGCLANFPFPKNVSFKRSVSDIQESYMRDVVRSVLDLNLSLTERSVKETEKDNMPDHGVE